MTVWILFIVAIALLLVLDLGILNRKAHVISLAEATAWTTFWAVLGLVFSAIVYCIYKQQWIVNPNALSPWAATLKYLTGYVVELSLSMDNIFVIAVIFSSFGIPQQYQHRVLFWGILGAIFFRISTIHLGVVLLSQFSWITYLFGAFLLFTALRLLRSRGTTHFQLNNSPVFKAVSKILPLTPTLNSQKFFIRDQGAIKATPLLAALVVIECTDILFAVDSIPAVLAITSDPFLVFSSNILAVLGLRSLYFFLSHMVARFVYLKYSLGAILLFVGIKLIVTHHLQIPEWLSLACIVVTLGVGVLASIARQNPKKK